MKKLTAFLIIMVFCALNIEAQNKLWLNNGKQIEIGEFRLDPNGFIGYKTLKNKYKSIESIDVFSIIEKNGQELLIYKPDSTLEGAFNLIEMRAFVQGQTDALNNFKSPWITGGGVVLMSAAPLVINPVFVLLVAGSYCTIIGITKPVKNNLEIPAQYTSDNYYLEGYKKEVKRKRIRNAIIGSGIGLAIGYTAFAIVGSQK